MASDFDRAVIGLNRAVIGTFGDAVVLVAPDGRRVPIAADWRQEPVEIAAGHGVVSTYQPMLGIDLNLWPPGLALPDEDWRVDIAPDPASVEDRSGRWEISEIQRPGGAWIDLLLTNRRR
ncbi:hypothetical protein [Magnetospirillum fulvum]|uniref:Uncharacterized protein n=1 Tax=Magnetospirillum fulvum MGU-K5 TaxID=1316936 RepID=S9TS53_MAGFU|nr:hypothetical protein [Magnetospirillum fulvum]EPY01385.1 hypothetical protein K678_11326 [Magnetospirillum fulvum MGU-K5]